MNLDGASREELMAMVKQANDFIGHIEREIGRDKIREIALAMAQDCVSGKVADLGKKTVL